MVPSGFSASMWKSPADSWPIPLPAPIVFTGRVTGMLDGALPSWPALSSPQAHTVRATSDAGRQDSGRR